MAGPSNNYAALKALSPAPAGVEEAAPAPQTPMGRYGQLNVAHAEQNSMPQPATPDNKIEQKPTPKLDAALDSAADLVTGTANAPTAPTAPAPSYSPANSPFMAREATWMNKPDAKPETAPAPTPSTQPRHQAPSL